MARFNEYLYDPEDASTPDKVMSDIPEFGFACPDIDQIIRYTIYVYDPHTDLLKLFPSDFTRRKREAALKAGFQIRDDGKFDQWAEDCFVGENDDYNAAIVAFVARFNISDLPAFVMYREIFFSEFKAAMSATDSKTKREAMGNAETARKQINDLERKLFTDDEVLNIRSALYRLAETQRLMLRPEHMAERIERKELEAPLKRRRR